MDIKLTLHEDSSIKTDIYYKPTKTHAHLPWNNIPYNLPKRIIVSVMNTEKVEINLNKFKWF